MKPQAFDIKLLLQSDLEPTNMSPRTLQKWRIDQQGLTHARESRATEEESISGESSPEHGEDKKVLEDSEKNQEPDAEAPEEEAIQEEPKGCEDYISVTPDNCPTVEIRLNGPEPAPEDGTGTKKKNGGTYCVSLSSRVFKRRDEKDDDPEHSKRRKEEEKLTKLMDQLESDTQRPDANTGLTVKVRTRCTF